MSESDLRLRVPAPQADAQGEPVRTAAAAAPGEPGTDGSQGWHWRRGAGRFWVRPSVRLLNEVQVGLDIGSRWIKYAVVRQRLKSRAILAAGGIPIASHGRGEMGRIRAQIAALLTAREKIACPDARWLVGIGRMGTMVRMVELPRMPQRELAEAVLWQAQKKFPFPLEDAHVAISYLKTPPRQPVKAIVAAALKRQVEDLLFLLSEAGIDPAALVLPVFGMAETLHTTGTVHAGEFTGVINIGAERSLFAVYRGVHLEFFRELDVGTGDVEQALSEDTETETRPNRKETPFLKGPLFGAAAKQADDAEGAESFPERFEESLERLVLEIQSTLEYYAAQSGGLRISKFLLSGGGAVIPGLAPHLAELLELPVHVFAPASPGLLPANVDPSLLAPAPIWSGALGYALLPRSVPNLLPEAFIRHREKRVRALAWRTTTVGALSAAVLLSGAEYFRAAREAELLAGLRTQLAQTGQRLDQIGVGQIEAELRAYERWGAALQHPDLRAGSLMRVVAALTPETIVINRIDSRVSDSGWARTTLTGEVRAEHTQNEVVLASYVESLRTSGYLQDVVLNEYRTARHADYEQITFGISCKVPLEMARP